LVKNILEILVTGSFGFIGRHISNALLERGDKVRQFDVANNNDIRDQDSVMNAIKGVDAAVHLGALAEITYSFERPSEVASVNIIGTINVLEACRKFDVRKFIFASSSSVYGAPEKLPVSEDDSLKPVTPYGLTKLVGEQYAELYHELYGLKVICLRYLNVYGSGQARGIVGDSLNAIRNGKPVVVFGDGKQTRDFVHVSDVVQANLLSLDSNDTSTGIYNIGTGVETSILDLINLIQNLTGTHKIEYGPKRIGDIERFCADISRAKSELKYRPKVSLREGLLETITAKQA